MVMSPVGLDEDGVDLLQVDAFGLVADGLQEGTEAEVADAAQEAFSGADDEGEGFLGEGVVSASMVKSGDTNGTFSPPPPHDITDCRIVAVLPPQTTTPVRHNSTARIRPECGISQLSGKLFGPASDF